MGVHGPATGLLNLFIAAMPRKYQALVAHIQPLFRLQKENNSDFACVTHIGLPHSCMVAGRAVENMFGVADNDMYMCNACA